MLPANTATILIAAGYDSQSDFICADRGGVISIDAWTHKSDKPTDQQVNDWANNVRPLPTGLTFDQWVKEKQDRDSEKITLRSSIAADIQAIDDYFALPAPTNAQHFAQMRHVSRCMRRVLRFIGRELLS